jgi:tetratricopeptide (TPR) repeat protein
MALCRGSTRESKQAAVRRANSRIGMPFRVVFAVSCLSIAHFIPADAHAQPDTIAVGGRVARKSGDLMLQVGNSWFSPGEDVLIYRVVSAEGRWLWLQSERGLVEGWADADDVIPVPLAEGFFTARIAKDARDPFLFAARGHIRRDKGDLDGALRDYNRAIQLNSERLWFYFERAALWSAKKEYARARADYDEVIVRRPESVDAYLSRGGAWCSQRQYDRAIADYNRAIKLDPVRGEAFFNRGRTWGLKKEFPSALADLSHAIRLDPRNALAYSTRGYIRQQLDELDRAFKDYNHAIKLDPRLAIAYIDRGTAWAARNEFQKALADLNAAVRLEPGNALAYASRGIIWQAIQEHVKAIDDFAEAIRIDPDCELAYLNRGAIWHENKEYSRAIADYSAAIRIDPHDALAYRARGDAWRDKLKYDEALADYSEAIRLDPTSAESLNNRAWLLATCPDAGFRDGKEAVRSAIKACDLTQWKIASLLDTLSAAYAEAGQFDDAVKSQEWAIALLTTEAEKADYRTRLTLYASRQPFRQPPS